MKIDVVQEAKTLFPKSLGLSPWLSRAIERESLAECLINFCNSPIHQWDLSARLIWHQQKFSTEDLPLALRRLRNEHFALCMVRDVEFSAPLHEIVSAMTRFAEFAILTIHNFAKSSLMPRFGVPRNTEGQEIELHIVGMGKLGGGELNVSSDIDLIFLYPEEGESDGEKKISTDEYFTRMGKKIINGLNDINAEGQVFRVDMRLRPHGDSGPLVCSFDMFENYLIRDGREWERYAWIKGRLLIGNQEKNLQSLVQPFVFRKYLDFTAMESMFDLHRQIREQVKSKAMIGNIKLGVGGIREIEFIAQLMQLMRGGRRPELRQKPTCVVLHALAKAGFLSSQQAETLIQHYEFLRRLEHRLQYQEDQQTQTLPLDSLQIKGIAESLSLTLEAFQSHLSAIQNYVSQEFTAMFSKETSSLKPTAVETSESLSEALPPIASTQTLDCLWPIYEDDASFSSSELREVLTAHRLHPHLIDDLLAQARHSRVRHLRDQPKMDHAMLVRYILQSAKRLNTRQSVETNDFQTGDWLVRRSLNMLVVLARRPSYLRLLAHSQASLDRLLRFLSASRWGADFLAQHPFLLDDLLDPRLLEQSFHRATFAEQLRAGINDSMDAGEQMNVLRESHHAEIFRLLAQDLEGLLTVEILSDHLSDLADEILTVTLSQCWKQQRSRHRDTPQVAIIAYGKLGGKELGYSSDLDLVLIRDTFDEEGAVPYNKLAISLTHWLSASTEAGQLFETDYRLRPDGDAGQLVPTMEGFAEYYRHKAWLWEHQALTRARFCAGNPLIGEQFEALRREILCLPRDALMLRHEINAMRIKMRSAQRIPESQFNLKHSVGGIIDIEFIVQWAVLSYAHHHPDLTRNIGNIALLHRCGELSILPLHLAQDVALAYRDYRRAQHIQRLNDHQKLTLNDPQWHDHAHKVKTLWLKVFGEDSLNIHH